MFSSTEHFSSHVWCDTTRSRDVEPRWAWETKCYQWDFASKVSSEKLKQLGLKMYNNDRGRDAIIAVQEERARIGGVEVSKKTLVAATDEGLVCNS